MARYLITQSLLSSWSYCFDCSEGCEEDARAEFLSALRREKKEPTDAMLNGIAFENEVYAAAAGLERKPHKEWEHGIQTVAAHIVGAPVQVKAQRDIEVGGITFLVYGILDALKAGIIYDVKFTDKTFSNAESDPGVYGKYLGSPQHPAYFYIVPEAHEFRYLLSDGEDIYIETYTRSQSPNISEYISQFMDCLKSNGLWELYAEHWSAL